MALLSKASPKNSTGSYSRVFGNTELGDLITKVQSVSIANGNELENIIIELVKKDNRVIKNIDEFLKYNEVVEKEITYLLPKNILKESEIIDFAKHEPDFVIFKIDKQKRHCYIVELKDGHVFDTKKLSGEKETLKKFQSYISKKLQYSTSIHMCCFNEEDKEKIKSGLKGSFLDDEIMTGQEFCSLLGIDYNIIIKRRKKDSEDNFNYFIEQLLEIQEVKQKILQLVQ